MSQPVGSDLDIFDDDVPDPTDGVRSRRSLFRGAVVIGAGVAGAGIAGIGTATPAWAAARSQNGWPGITSAGSSHLNRGFTANGVAFPGGVRTGAAGAILHYVAVQFDRRVEPLHAGWCWGWNYRPIRGGSALSNHASGTAIDCNAPRHPMGRSGTFSAAQRREIRAILRYCEGAVRWGGDYHGRKDEMHFELDVGPNSPLITKVVHKINGAPARAPKGTGWPRLTRGSTGFRVRVLQELLRHRGYHVAVDGVFGRQTQTAVTRFKRSRRLNADGIAGRRTWAALTPAVRYGSRGHAVRGAQRALRAHHQRLVVDGVFGPQTRRALTRFQRTHGLAGTGVANDRTWRKLV